MKVIHFAQFSAPFRGSFIDSIEKFAQESDFESIYCFPNSCERNEWMNSFKRDNKVYFIDDDVSKSNQKILEIIQNEQPDIIHTHFDGYDTTIVKIVNSYNKYSNKNVKVLWHKRNFYTYHRNLFKRLYQLFYFTFKYSYYGKHVSYIYVSDGIKNFIRKHQIKFFKPIKYAVIPNGIDVDKFYSEVTNTEKSNFIFISYGGRNKQKRIDLLLKAGNILQIKNVNFKILITKGVDTEQIVEQMFGSKIPNWLQLIDQSNDVKKNLQSASCFVSCSIHETFSNAIAEATLVGLPVIQSDIEGTLWNSKNPSTFVFKSKDVDSLVSAMLEVINYPEEELKQNCKITQLNNKYQYSLDVWCKKINQFYQEINDKA